MEEMEGFESHGLEIQAAVLHVLDGRRRSIVMSEETLDLQEPSVGSYVKRMISKCRNDMRVKPGSFLEGSPFAQEMERYFRRECSLPEFSAAVLRETVSYLEKEEAASFDVLAADYRMDDIPYVAFVFLELQDTVSHMTDVSEGKLTNTIVSGSPVLPQVNKKPASFACVNMLSKQIGFTDETKWKDGASVLKDRLLHAKAGVSRKEVVESVKEIACEVAEEYHDDETIVLSRMKESIAETVKEGLPLSTDDLAEAVFSEAPEMSAAFIRKARERELPETTELPKASVTQSMRRQRISTDTGIEISFPASYFRKKEFIEFVTRPDGTISIEIKQVGRITNK